MAPHCSAEVSQRLRNHRRSLLAALALTGDTKNEAPFSIKASPESMALAGKITSRISALMADNYQPEPPTTSEDTGRPNNHWRMRHTHFGMCGRPAVSVRSGLSAASQPPSTRDR